MRPCLFRSLRAFFNDSILLWGSWIGLRRRTARLNFCAAHFLLITLLRAAVCGNSNGGAQLRPLLSTEACRRARETRSGPTGQNKGSRSTKKENSDTRPPTFSRHLRLIEINCRGRTINFFLGDLCRTDSIARPFGTLKE